jgi:branched-chain amino acid aminotransferase
VDGFPIGDGKTAGEITQAIEARYHDTVRAVTGRHDEWLTPVAPGAPSLSSPVGSSDGRSAK